MTSEAGEPPDGAERSEPNRQATFARRVLAFLEVYWSDLVYAALALALTAWVAWEVTYIRNITYHAGSDYWEHSAVLRALIEDPWRPRHPMTGSEVGSPRFSPHFLIVALLCRPLRFDPIEAMGVAAVLNTVLFLAGSYSFFRVYFRNRLASLLGLIVLFGGWLDAPHFSNVYKLSVYFSVAGYPSAAALGVTLLTFSLALVVLRAERERRGLLALLTLAWAYVYITHPLTAMMALAGGGILALTEPGVQLRRRLLVGATVPVGLGLSLLWPYYPAVRMVAEGTVDRVSRDLEKANYELHPFYDLGTIVEMIGLAWPGVLVIPYFVARRKHLFLALTPQLMLVVFAANALVPLPLGHRFILLAIPFFHASTVWVLLEAIRPAGVVQTLFARWGAAAQKRATWAARAVVGAVLLWATVSNVQAADKRFEQRVANRASPVVRYSKRVAELAGPNAVVLASKVLSWSLPTYGTRVVAFHHRNPLVPDALQRNADVARFYSPRTKDEEREATLAKYGVTHVIVSGRTGPADEFLAKRGERMAVTGNIRLYKLNPR